MGDPPAHYRLTASDLAERDLLIATEVRERGVSLAMVLSDGDSSESRKVRSDAVEGVLTRFDRLIRRARPGSIGGRRGLVTADGFRP